MALATKGLAKGTLTVLGKLKKHPHYKGQNVTDEELIPIAKNLSDPDYIRGQFSYLLDSFNSMVLKSDDTDQDMLKSLEFTRIRKKDQESLANAMKIPVKLILRKLRQGKPPLANTLSQLLQCEYGPLHSTLQVGEITIEWGREELVIPDMLPRLPGDLETQATEQSIWHNKTKKFVRELDDAGKRRSHEERFDVMFSSMSEKVQLIERLVDVIITYNCEKSYSIFKCNCQHFTRDALNALGYKDSIKFSGKMSDFFEQLKNGKLTVPKEYSTHEQLDDYVMRNLDRLTVADMEYLLCQYFKHHLPSMEEIGDDLDDWVCGVQTCQSEELDSRVKDRSSFRPTHHEDDDMTQLPEEFRALKPEDQEKRMRQIKKKGYKERVHNKLKQQPNKELLEDESIIDKLTEREKFRETFCCDIIEGVSEALVMETSADYQKKDISEAEARERAAKRMKVFYNFPVKLLLYNSKRNSSKLSLALQVGNYYFKWSKTSLIIPKRIAELTSKQPVLKIAMSQEGAWSSHVNELWPQISQAVSQLDYERLIALQYQLAARKDELLSALIDTTVRYNRAESFNLVTCNNLDFLSDAQKALGISRPSKPSNSFKDHMKKVKQVWEKQMKEKIKIKSHGELDMYITDTYKLHEVNREMLEYFIAQYYEFHLSDWEREPCDQWSCVGQNCKLPMVERSMELYMW